MVPENKRTSDVYLDVFFFKAELPLHSMKFERMSPVFTARRGVQAIFDGQAFVYSAQRQNG